MLHPRGPAVALGHRDSLLHSVYTDKAPTAPPRQQPQQQQQQPSQKQQRRDGQQAELQPAPPVAVPLECQSPELVQVSTSFCECVWPHLEPPSSGPAQGLWAQGPPAVTWEVQLQQVADDCSQAPREPKDSDWRTVCKGEARRCKVDGLRPGRSYAARVVPHIQQALHQVEGGVQLRLECNAAKPIVFSTPATAPSAPAPPGLVSRERKQLKLKWANPDETGGAGPLKFVLSMSPAPADVTAAADSQGFVEVYRGEDKTFKVQRLQPGTRYSFRLQAINAVGESAVGLCSAFTTQATVPAIPEPPVPVASTSGSITLRWAAPFDNGSPVGLYQLEVDNGSGGTEFTMVYSGPNTSATANGLHSGVHYRFRLRANNDEGWSVWSSSAMATTAAVAPASPGVVTVVNATRGNAMVSWGSPADDGGSPVTTYEVQLQAKSKAAQEQMGNDWLAIFSGQALACSINSLRAGCIYRARVRAANASGWGQFCIPTDVSTLPDVPDVMDVPSVASCTSTSMIVMWQPPLHDGGSKFTSFRLELVPATSTGTDAGLRTFPIRDPAACSVEVAGLLPGSVYRLRVQANNQQGPGPWSEWADLCTAPAEPLAPALPAVTASTSTSVSLLWQPPHGQGAHIASYVVEVAMLGPAAEEARRQQQLAAWQQHRVLLDQQAALAAASGGAVPADHVVAPSPPEPAPLQWLEVFQGVHSACEVRDLEPATSLLIRVAAINLVGRGPWSPVLAFTTPPAPPAVPEDLEMQPLSSSSLAVMWRPPVTDNGAPVSMYTVECRNGAPDQQQASSKSGGAWQQVYVGPELRCVVERLQPGRLYALRVKAANPMGSGPWSNVGQCMTLPAAPGPVLGRLAFSQRTATAVRIRWEPPSEANGAPVLHYTMELARVQPVNSTLHPSISHGGSITPTGTGPATKDVQAPTSSLSACSVGPGSLTPSTSPCSDDGQDGPLSFVVAYQGRDASCKLADLQPGMRYMVRVAAANAAGQGPFSMPEGFSTSLSAPSPPDMTELAESGVSADASSWVLVRWQPPVPSASAAQPVSYEVAAAPIAPLPQPGVDGAVPWTASAERERDRAWEKAAASGTAVKVTVSARSQLECRLERLQPQTSYSVRLRSVGAEGTGHSTWSTEMPLLTPGVQRAKADSDAGSDAPASAAAPLTSDRVTQAAAPGSKKRSKAAAKAAQRNSSTAAAEADSGPAPAPAPVHKAKVAKVAKVAPAKAKGPPVKKSAVLQMWQQQLWPKLKVALLLMLVVLLVLFCIGSL